MKQSLELSLGKIDIDLTLHEHETPNLQTKVAYIKNACDVGDMITGLLLLENVYFKYHQ